jgi:hypothetical protein
MQKNNFVFNLSKLRKFRHDVFNGRGSDSYLSREQLKLEPIKNNDLFI